ncbi:hypothetical protein BUALT_Bualt09G0102200 [Buddleja alternifolia]|uniref:FAR1 domain-containing protein n=1 Tax=Buddleja alternifolia TaxID=168488 RepID=A0AAV6X1Y7_9LAMI|nr:hypothetical protein BUALT_Bualt09G0102200 [Buddleja alternifolia]
MEETPHISPEANNFCQSQDLEENYGEDAEITEQCGEHFESPEPSLSKHQEVHSVSSLIHELENRLAIGQVMKSVEDTYLLYCKYAHAKGFSVRKGDQKHFPRSNEFQAKELECSCEGVKDERRSRGRIPNYQKPITRTKCKARIRIGQEKGKEWRVTRFVIEHNHEMVATDQTHLLRSSRNISHAQKSTLEAMVNAGISTTTAVSFMEEEARGPENLGFIRKDAYNYLSSLKKQTKIKNGDASELLKHFLAKSNNEPFFYWDVQLDDENRVMNFFFRDYRCRIDYEYFGDVLSVDTTYKTNRFKEFWYKCMNHCDSEEEFEATWRKMIHEYNLSGHKWLNGMYKLRQKWATTFSKHRFSAGLLATSRSKGTNSVLKKAGDRTISLYDFVLSYEKIQKTWRENEKVEDTRCRHGKLSMIVNNNLLLNHTADVYTLTIYKLFEKELVNSLSTEFTEDPLFIDPFVI